MSGRSGVAKFRFGLKSTEMILACVCTGLLQYIHTKMIQLYPITFGGYVLINSGLLLGFITQEYVCTKVDVLFTLAGLCLNIVAGSFLIHEGRHDIDTACGSLAIINGGLLMVDAIYMYRTTDEYTPHN